MNCPKCGSINPDGASFCQVCGEKLINVGMIKPDINANQGQFGAQPQQEANSSATISNQAPSQGVFNEQTNPSFNAEPQGNFGAQPQGNFGAQPQGNFSAQPQGDYSQTSQGFNAEPQGNFGAQPQGNFSAQPQGNFGAQPQGNFSAQPQGNFGAQPQGNFGAQPQGNFGAQPQNPYGQPQGGFAQGQGAYGNPYGQMNPMPKKKINPLFIILPIIAAVVIIILIVVITGNSGVSIAKFESVAEKNGYTVETGNAKDYESELSDLEYYGLKASSIGDVGDALDDDTYAEIVYINFTDDTAEKLVTTLESASSLLGGDYSAKNMKKGVKCIDIDGQQLYYSKNFIIVAESYDDEGEAKNHQVMKDLGIE